MRRCLRSAGGNKNEVRERSEPFFLAFPREKKPLYNGSYEHRVPKIKKQTLFCTRDVCVCDSGMFVGVCDSTS